MNVLITTAGRRTSLVRAFADEAHNRGGVVFASDVDALAPALYVADEAIRTPLTGDPGYVDELLSIVRRHEIKLVIPTIDADLPILAEREGDFAALGCRLAISTAPFVDLTLDKHLTGVSFGAEGIHVPWSWLPPLGMPADLPDEVFAKPRRGSASLNLFQVTRENLGGVLPLVPDPIVQEVLEGPEITIDALLDFEGRPIHYVPRTRLRTLGGESVEGVTLDHEPETERWIERVLRTCSKLGALGPLTIQAFQTAEGLVLSEINARFGGGFPLAMAAGGTYAAWLMDMASGIQIPPRLREYEAGLYMTRYYVEYFTTTPFW